MVRQAHHGAGAKGQWPTERRLPLRRPCVQATSRPCRRLPQGPPASRSPKPAPSRAAPRPNRPRASGSSRSAAPRRWSIRERIITRLRAEGYELSRRLRRRRRGGGQHLRLPQLGQAGEPRRHRRGDGRERPRDRHRLPRRREGAHPRRPPRRAGGHRPAPVRGRWWPPCTRPSRRCTIPFLDLVPPEGLHLTPRHYAYLKISEGCNNRCSFCIIPQLRGRLASRPAAHVMAEAERLVKAGVKELLVISQDTSAYGLDIGYAESAWKGRPLKARFLDLCAGAGLARRLGAAALRLSLSARRRGAAADGGGQDPALPRHPLPARLARGAEGHAPPGAPGEDAGAAARAGARSAPTSPSARPSSSASPARRRRTSQLLLDWLDEAKLARVGCFKYEPVDGAAANALAGAVPEEVKEERWHRFMAAQQEVSRELMAAKVGRTHRRDRRRGGRGGRDRPLQVGRAGDRRLGVPQRRDRARSPATSSRPASPTPTSTTCGPTWPRVLNAHSGPRALASLGPERFPLIQAALALRRAGVLRAARFAAGLRRALPARFAAIFFFAG